MCQNEYYVVAVARSVDSLCVVGFVFRAGGGGGLNGAASVLLTGALCTFSIAGRNSVSVALWHHSPQQQRNAASEPHLLRCLHVQNDLVLHSTCTLDKQPKTHCIDAYNRKHRNAQSVLHSSRNIDERTWEDKTMNQPVRCEIVGAGRPARKSSIACNCSRVKSIKPSAVLSFSLLLR